MAAGRPTSACPRTSEGRRGGLRGPRGPMGTPSVTPYPRCRCSRQRRKCRQERPLGTGVRGRLAAPLVPYRMGYFVAVPRAARRPASTRRLAMGVPAGWSPASPVTGGADALCSSRASARGRRGMGSVDGWPMATPTTKHLGAAATEDPARGASRAGPPPAGGPGHAWQRLWPPPARAPVPPGRTWTGGSRSPQGPTAGLVPPADSRGAHLK